MATLSCILESAREVSQAFQPVQRLRSSSQMVTPANLGTGRGVSVLELVHAFAAASGRSVPYRLVDRRAGDLAAYWAEPVYAQQELDWHAMYDLDHICGDAWRWQQMNPNGYLG